MALNDHIHYPTDTSSLYIESVSAATITQQIGTPVYVYSEARMLDNLQRLQTAFSALDTHIHYSAKANANITLLRTLIDAGAGIDCVSAGEIHRALCAGAGPADIVFAGVGKTPQEIHYAVEQGIGWFNVENVHELTLINDAVHACRPSERQRVALRLNPDVTANTHPHIATGHGGAKFGLTADAIADCLAHQDDYSHLTFAGIHVHIGSQLGDTQATIAAVEKARDLIAPYPQIRTMNIGGGFPAVYDDDGDLPAAVDFADALAPLLDGYTVILEPGRSIIGDAGVLLTDVLYTKSHAGQHIVIVDASMSELIRPALYNAHHAIVPIQRPSENTTIAQVVGPVCETTDVLGKDVSLPPLNNGDTLAILTAGAYGMVMASNYNARPRPAEVLVSGETWRVIRQRETWDDLIALETDLD